MKTFTGFSPACYYRPLALQFRYKGLMAQYLLGIDVGTGGTRALVVGPDGRIVASATEQHQAFASPQIGWAEQRPEDWWRATCLAVRQALAAANLGSEPIACVGFSGQMH